MTIALRQRPLASVVMGIVKSANGAWFDPSDMTTMYQDAAGTIPVTAVEQPVGLMLDKSRGMMLGQELVSNGTFDSGTEGCVSGLGYGATITETGGVCSFTSVNSSARIRPPAITTNIGAMYTVTITILSLATTVIVRPSTDSTQGLHATSLGDLTVNSVGTYTFMFKARTTTTYLWVVNNGSIGTVVSLDNISVRELYGYHATQSITASRPTLSARYNLLLNSATLSTQNVTTIAAKYTLSFTGTGTVGLSGTATGSLVGTSVSDRVSLTFIPTAGTLTLTVTGSVTLAMLNLGTSAMTYQEITTATSYDSNPSLFPWFLRFDGIDDSMVYDSPYASSNNPSTHIIGVASRSLSKNLGFLTINPTSTTTGTQRSISINSESIVKADCRNSPGATSGTVDIASIHVFSASFGGTKMAAISVDGGAYTTDISGVTPNTTSTDTAIGKGITNLSTAFNFYGSISVGADLTEHQRHICERYLGRKSGVQL